MADKSLMTTGEVAHAFGVPEWQVRTLYTEGRLPEPARVGTSRAIAAADLPHIWRAFRKRWPTTPTDAPPRTVRRRPAAAVA